MATRVIVDNRVHVPVVGDAAEVLRNLFRHPNPGDGGGYEETWLEEGGETTAPRGGMGRVRAFLEFRGVGYEVVDRRCAGDFSLLDDPWEGRIPNHDLELWDFQERVVRAALERQNCIVQAATGSGKSSAVIAMASRAQVPAIIVVNAAKLKDQWVARLSKELSVAPERIGVIGDGERRTAPVTVAMQQTLARGIDEKWLRAFGFFAFDEVDIAAAPTYFASVDPWPAKYRVGVTATLERHDRRDYLVRDLFGEVVAEVPREEAVAKGKIVDVEIRVVPTGIEAPWYHAARISNNKFRLFAAHKRLLRELAASEDRNALITGIVQSEAARGRACLVLSNRVDHCRALEKELREDFGLRTGLMLGGKSQAEEFDRAKAGLLAGEVDVVVATDKAMARAQDLPALEVAVAAMRVGNNATLASQVVGRLCRACDAIGKSEGTLYLLHEEKISGKADVEKLLRGFKRVVVRDGEGWVPAADYLAQLRPGGIRDPRRKP